MNAPADDLQTFLSERNRAFETLDLGWARNRIQMPSSDDQLLLAIMHKARYECTAIRPELRRESGAWLAERGYGSMSGPILPNGELPTGA
jgi:hypothetical protein